MARAAAQLRDRRGDITKALYRCISQKGFSNTTLRDIAENADMTPSHIGYYFDNKAAILEYYASAICLRNTAELPDLDEPDEDRLIDAIATFCMGKGQMSAGLLGVIQELTGLAVHDPKLHDIKAKHTVVWRRYLEAFFDRVRPRAGMSPRHAAYLANSILVGLNTNSLFDPELDRELARHLFVDALRGLTSIGPDQRDPIRLVSATEESNE